jgi:competence protein ComEC
MTEQGRFHHKYAAIVNWRQAPFLRVLLAYIIGIVTAWYWPQYYTNIGYAVLFVLALMYITHHFLADKFQYRWLFGGILYGFIALLGGYISLMHNESLWGNHFGKNLDTNEHQFVCLVSDQPIVRSNVRVEATVQYMDGVSKIGKIQLSIDSNAIQAPLEYGDIITCAVHPNPIKSAQNPYSFDAQKFNKIKNIYHQGFVTEGKLQVLQKGKGNAIWALAIKWQHHLMSILSANLPTQDEFAVGSALIVGYRSDIPEDVLNSYIVTGAMHVLSVSGLHVGVLAMILHWLLGFIKTKNRYWHFLRIPLEISVIWAFALISGGSSSVLRAALMFSFVIISRAFGEKISVYNTLGASALLLLTWNPYMVFDVGFQLSYLGVLGIVYFFPLIYRQFYFTNKTKDRIWQWLSVGFAAQLVTAPLSLYYFHQFPTYFWLSGILVVPLSAVVLGIGMALFSLSALGLNLLVTWLGKLLWVCIYGMNVALGWMKHLPFSLVQGVWVDELIVVALYLGIACFIVLYLTRQMRWGVGLMAIMAILCMNFSWRHFDNLKQTEMQIYSVRKHTLIDIFEKNTLISIRDTALSIKTENFAAANNRFRKGSKPQVVFDDHQAYVSANVMIHKGVIHLGETCIILAKADELPVAQLCKYLIVSNIGDSKLEDLILDYKPQQVIIDGTVSLKKVNAYREILSKLNIPCHAVLEEGAFCIKLEH